MSSFFNSDGSFPLQFAIIFLVIFVVLAGLVFAFRRLAGRGLSLSSKAGPRGRQPRLGIVDIYELDRQRQLILLRRDNVEHLLLVGGPNDVVVERNINRGVSARMPADNAGRSEPKPEPEPDSELSREPEQLFDMPSFEIPAYANRAGETPEAVRQPASGSGAQSPILTRAPDYPPPAGIETAESDFSASVPPPRRGEAPPSRAPRRTPPSLVNFVSEAVTDRPRPAEPAIPQPVPPPALPAEISPPFPVTPSASRPIDAAILSDMARQLEEAIRRPSSAAMPSAAARAQAMPLAAMPAMIAVEPSPLAMPESKAVPEIGTEPASPPAPDTIPIAGTTPVPDAGPAAPPPFAPNQSRAAEPVAPNVMAIAETNLDFSRPTDPMAAAMAKSQDGSAADGLFSDAEPVPDASHEPEAIAPHSPVGEMVEPEPFLPEPPAALEEIRTNPPKEEAPASPPVPLQPPEPKEPVSKPVSQNPFSVEEIEAEFARLLGRPLDRRN